MVFQSEQKQGVIEKFRSHDKDTGSTEVQIALLTERIRYLTDHFKFHKKDVHSRRGLLKVVNQRRKMLDYLKKKDADKYKQILKELNIRK